nr:cancer/testis antigen family 45 member A6-like [Saimiri boliviensis boliviensis]
MIAALWGHSLSRALSQPARDSSLGADVGHGAHLSLDVAHSQLGCVAFSLDLFIPDGDAYRMLSLAEKVAAEPQNAFKHPRECESSSSQKRQKMALLVRKRGVGDGLIGGSAMSKEKKVKTGVGIPPSQLDSQIDDFTGFSKDGLMQKPGRNAPVGVIVTSSFSGDDLEVTEILPFSRIQKDINAEIKGKLMKEILHYFG